MGITKIRGIILFMLILSPLLMGGISDKPIVVKDEVETKIKIEMIDSANLQRILEDFNDRVKGLEDKVVALERQITELKALQ